MNVSEHTSHVSPRAESPLTPAVLALEKATALDPVVAVGNELSGALVADPRVRGLLQGRQVGHAVHPLLVQVPLGTWISATLLDVLGGSGDRDAARRLVGLGVLAAVPSALTGWAEYAGSPARDRRVGVVHAAANGVAAGLQVGSWLARRSGRHGLGQALNLAGVSLAGAGGYLGGHLSVARKVGSRDAAYAGDPDVT
ncbi:DUF2231 domain-containing protein [Agilicoccus flavus]|uniref:DUF2231 domain-containing protein n=1 Tax=Agilicoccus flavus TaxID=2775968 RepID=UPI001CF71BB6|nr:DUF2231 domain-containing protein [Agilicoccus flavus]